MSTAKWSNEVVWQKDSNYIIRCIDEIFAPSKSKGAPMITLAFEIAAPETMEVAGVTYLIAGVSSGLKMYFPMQSLDDDGNIDTEKTASCQERYKKFLEECGQSTEFNPENPKPWAKGKLFLALLTDNKSEQRKSPTKEQLAKGIRQGDILINPKTKKPLEQHYPQIQQIFGLAPEDTNKPY